MQMNGNTRPRGGSFAAAILTALLGLGLATGTAAEEATRKISDEKASEIAREAVPGEVMDVAVEHKLGAKRLVVEVLAEEDMAETDVIIDMETGEVLKVER